MEKCCADLKNRYVAEIKPNITVEKCKVCERRHIILEMNAGVYGLTGKGV